MSPRHLRSHLAAIWSSLALLTYIAAWTSSGLSVLLLAVIGLVPIMMLALWKEPLVTIDGAVRATEERR